MLRTLRDRWGLRIFMMFSSFLPNNSNNSSKKMGARGDSAALGLAALAAVFPQVVGQASQAREIGGVVVVRPLAARTEQPCIDQLLEVVTQRRRRQVDMRLDVTRRSALG